MANVNQIFELWVHADKLPYFQKERIKYEIIKEEGLQCKIKIVVDYLFDLSALFSAGFQYGVDSLAAQYRKNLKTA